MVWFNVDDNMSFHPKAIQAGNAALGLWVRSGSWCCHTLTNGFVPKQIARSLGTIGQCKALVSAGLWREVEGGYQFHEWAERQQTKEDVETRRKSERERKAELRRRSRVPAGQPSDDQSDTLPESVEDSDPEPAVDSAPDSTPVSGDPFPSIPFPSSSSGYLEGESLVAIARENEPPTPFCPKHPGGTPDSCGPCADARKRWVAAKLERDEAAERQAAEHAERERQAKHRAAEDRSRAIAACSLGCVELGGYLDDGQGGRALCDHRVPNASRPSLREQFEAHKRLAEPDAPELRAPVPFPHTSPVSDIHAATPTDPPKDPHA